jgi:hypothetical protein
MWTPGQSGRAGRGSAAAGPVRAVEPGRHGRRGVLVREGLNFAHRTLDEAIQQAVSSTTQ